MNTHNDTNPDPGAPQAQVVRVEQALAALLCLGVAVVAAIAFCTVWLSLANLFNSLPLGR